MANTTSVRESLAVGHRQREKPATALKTLYNASLPSLPHSHYSYHAIIHSKHQDSVPDKMLFATFFQFTTTARCTILRKKSRACRCAQRRHALSFGFVFAFCHSDHCGTTKHRNGSRRVMQKRLKALRGREPRRKRWAVDVLDKNSEEG